MSQERLPAIAHVSLGTNDIDAALAFYDRVLATIGLTRLVDMPDIGAAYGRGEPEFWVHLPADEQSATTGNGVHVAFRAREVAEVDAFHRTALDAGGADDGSPGLRPHYGPHYYGCFVRDPDGNKIEAICRLTA